MFNNPSAYLKQTNGMVPDKIGSVVRNLDYVSQKEVGKGLRYPEVLRGWLLRKNDVLAAENRGLSDLAITQAFRDSYIADNYKIKDEEFAAPQP